VLLEQREWPEHIVRTVQTPRLTTETISLALPSPPFLGVEKVGPGWILDQLAKLVELLTVELAISIRFS
jgi:hypothetical protein